MPSFLERYQAGEHEHVWSDLIALGDAVRNPPAYADAMAVARETMRRAQHNVEILIRRLHGLGYRFDTAQSAAQQSDYRIESLGRQMDALRANASAPMAEKLKGLFDVVTQLSSHHQQVANRRKPSGAQPAPAHPVDDPSVYCRATEQATRAIADAESRLGGPLPISLAAWYETFENVSFLGSHPELNPTRTPQTPLMAVAPSMLQGPGGEQRRKLAESLGFRIQDQAVSSPPDEGALPDPLVIAPLQDLLGDDDDSETGEGGGSFMISPDDLQKAHISGDVYYVDLPDRKADVIFQDWKGGYFVEYLRRAFKWGGFPGWERHPNPPTLLIEQLASDLLPI